MTGVRITPQMRARGVMAVVNIEAAVTALHAAADHVAAYDDPDGPDVVWLRTLAKMLAERAQLARVALETR